MNREPLIHWHLVNHNGTLRDPRGGVTHKRSAIWYGALHLRNNGPGPVEGASLEWKFGPSGMVGASFSLDPHKEDQVDFALGLPWVGSVFFGVSLRGWAANLLMSVMTKRGPGGGHDQEVSVRFFDEAVWWNLWHPRSSWSSGTPRWRSGQWHPLNTLFGRGEYSEVEGTRTEYVAELALPEGSYPVKVTMTLNEWKRARLDWFFARRRQVADVEGRIPMPRKGPWRAFSVATDEGLTTALGNAVVHIVQHRYGWAPSPSEVREVGGIPVGGDVSEVPTGGVVARVPDGVRLNPGDMNFQGDEVRVTASVALPGTLDHITVETHVEADDMNAEKAHVADYIQDSLAQAMKKADEAQVTSNATLPLVTLDYIVMEFDMPSDESLAMTQTSATLPGNAPSATKPVEIDGVECTPGPVMVFNPHMWKQSDTQQSWANAFQEIGLWAMHKVGVGPGQCERCMRAVPCIDFNMVDVGVGGITHDHEYYCPTHGAFSYGPINGFAVYQDDAEEEAGMGSMVDETEGDPRFLVDEGEPVSDPYPPVDEEDGNGAT